jgi:hypothetical protein
MSSGEAFRPNVDAPRLRKAAKLDSNASMIAVVMFR